MIEFVHINGYVNESVQEAGIPGIPGCVEHAFAIRDAIQEAKTSMEDLIVIWLDFVPHGLIEMAMENFWFPKLVKVMLVQYYNNFRMRFTTDGFTTEMEVGTAAGCTISVILFVLVMEIILKSTNADTAMLRTPLRAFMDDITVLAKSTNAATRILERLDELVTWSKMKFKAKKSRSCSFVKGKQKEIRFSVAGDTIPTVRVQPVKSLGRWYKGTLSDRHQETEEERQRKERQRKSSRLLIRLDYLESSRCLQFGLYPSIKG